MAPKFIYIQRQESFFTYFHFRYDIAFITYKNKYYHSLLCIIIIKISL
jgi:hypothetical protein